MATSSADEAPRGLEFLYDRHRLNVATSRAMVMAVIVPSSNLVGVSCRTPHQMTPVNALGAGRGKSARPEPTPAFTGLPPNPGDARQETITLRDGHIQA